MAAGSVECVSGADTPPATILVVEDEVLVRLVLADHLRDCGFHVVEAATGDEAITVLSADAFDIDIVFSDVQMPGRTDGFALARWVREHRPGIEVLLTSGDSQAAQKARDLCHLGPVLPKPYDHAMLVRRIQQMRERSRRHPG